MEGVREGGRVWRGNGEKNGGGENRGGRREGGGEEVKAVREWR